MVSVDVIDTRSTALRGVRVILLASILFGAMAVCVRVAGQEMAALQVAFVRFVGSLAVLLAVTRGRRLRPQPGNLHPLLLRGTLGAASICLYYLGIQNAGAGLATLLHCTYPIWTVLWAGAFIGEPITATSLVALALNIIGVVIVVGPGAHFSAGTTVGAGFALGASVLAGGAVATARHLRGSEEASLITTYFMGVGAILTAPALMGGLPPATPLLLIALSGVVLTSVGGQWLLHHGLGYTSAAQGSLAAATTVVSAALFEGLVLDIYPSLHTLVGATLMIVAVGLSVRRG
jgi:drug/metabolite transporter (DMT)-like permease